MTDQASKPWVTSQGCAMHLGIHRSTLLRLRRDERSPFREGVHYRRTGLSAQATLQWHLVRTEEAFTSLRVQPASQIETYAAAGAQ